jgi:hypothetical protein
MPEKDRQGGDLALSSVMQNHPVVLSNAPSSANKNNPKALVIVVKTPYLTKISLYKYLPCKKFEASAKTRLA